MNIDFDDLDNDLEFDDDEELDLFRALAETSGEPMYEGDMKVSLINYSKEDELMQTYKALKRSARGKNLSVTYEMNKPSQTMGSVTVCGKNISFSNLKDFMFAVNAATNLDIYPKVDGSVQMDFTFYGLTISI